MTAGAHWSARSGPGRSAGFTLIEILVAMAVLGLLLGVLVTGLRLARQMSEAASVRLDAADELLLAQDFLRRRLAGALPVASLADPGLVAFTGSDAALSFVAALPEHLGGELYRFAVGVDGTVPDRPLVVLVAPLADPTATPERFVLLRHVQALTIGYFGIGDPSAEEPPGWQESWAERESLPLLVRIDALIDEPPGTRWPTLVARPLVDYVPQ